MTDPSGRSGLGVVGVLLGVSLLTVGGFVGYYGTAGSTCGQTRILVSEVPAAEVDEPGSYAPYESLTDEQRRLFDEALAAGEAYDEDDDVEPFRRVTRDGRYYSVHAVIGECLLDPTTLAVGGGLVALVGAGILGVVLASRRRW